MNLRHVSTFLEVARQGSFARAAERLNYAQSTITLHIQELEADIGTALIERSSRTFRLTPAGRLLEAAGRDLAERVDEIKQEIADLAAGRAGTVCFATIEPMATETVPAVVAEFLRTRPGVHLTVDVGATSSVARAVAEGSADFGLCAMPSLRWHIHFEPLFTQRMGLLVRVNHPLAARAAVRLSDLRRERLLVTEEACSYRRAVDVALTRVEVMPAATAQIASLRAVSAAVVQGAGVALVPEPQVVPPGTVFKKVAGEDVSVRVGFVTRSEKRPPLKAAAAFMDLLRERLSDRPQQRPNAVVVNGSTSSA